MTRKIQKQTPEEIAEGQTPESTPEPKSEPLPGLGGAAPIEKPSAFSLDKFTSKRPPNIAGVATLLGVLPVLRLPEAKDFVRLHPNEETHWSVPLCFVNVPILGVKKETLHLIDEDLAIKYLQPKKILRHRLALASKPGNVFFLAEIPTTNLDNSWNVSYLQGCEQAKTLWTELVSLKDAGEERYKVDHALDPDAFEEPDWPEKTLTELIVATFSPGGRIIEHDSHPGLLRLIGAKQLLK